jgi:hypothetical protein
LVVVVQYKRTAATARLVQLRLLAVVTAAITQHLQTLVTVVRAVVLHIRRFSVQVTRQARHHHKVITVVLEL